jgi:transketolase
MFMAAEPAIQPARLEGMIHNIRGQRVMLDSDLATLYGVSTRRLKEQYRRNAGRFPSDFAFVLTRQEVAILRSQNATSSSHGGGRYLPVAFTEHRVIMLASVLNSEVAVEASVRVVRTFVRLREMVAATSELTQRLDELERRIEGHDHDLQKVFAAIRQLIEPPAGEQRREMGFHNLREQAAAYRTRPAKKRI